jgi:alpha-D-ribose 1-methylphosphonate 5-triphosphate synthase subunit PhnL
MILDVQHYTKQFTIHQLERSIPVFDEISFRLHRGEFLLISGPNGVGKSTLLRCLYRSYLPTRGQAIYHSLHGPVDLARAADVDVALLRDTEIGHVTQFLRPRPRVSALELVAEPLLSDGVTWPDAEREAQHWLGAFGLKPDLWQAYPTTFSGGEQQKVNLARALIRSRRLLLLDEPTASLDIGARQALVDRLAELKTLGVAMLGVFHHTEDVRDLIDGVIELSPPTDLDMAELAERAYVAQ